MSVATAQSSITTFVNGWVARGPAAPPVAAAAPGGATSKSPAQVWMGWWPLSRGGLFLATEGGEGLRPAHLQAGPGDARDRLQQRVLRKWGTVREPVTPTGGFRPPAPPEARPGRRCNAAWGGRALDRSGVSGTCGRRQRHACHVYRFHTRLSQLAFRLRHSAGPLIPPPRAQSPQPTRSPPRRR